MTESVWLLAARRTPVAPVNGALRELGVAELAVPVVRQLLQDAAIGADQIDQVILGNALYGGGNPARLVALAAGLPESVPALTVDTQCCSGLDALRLGAQAIEAGQADLVLAGGVESTSRRPIRQHRPLQADGIPVTYERPPFTPWSERDPDMADSAARLAAEEAIDLNTQNDWACKSHRKALAAKDRLAAECVPLGGLSVDAATRPMSPALAARTPVIARCGEGQVNVAGTALQADAAAVVLLASDEARRRLGTSLPAVLWRSGLAGGSLADSPPRAMVPVVQQLLAAQGVSPTDLQCAEVMEAFAVQAISNCRDLGLPDDCINRGGGALARGHPIGASGAILAVRAFHELLHADEGSRALLAIAAAGGLASATLLTREQ